MTHQNKSKDASVNIRPYLHQLYRGNARYFLLEITTTLLNVVLNLGIAWLLQKITDFTGGIDVGFSLSELTLISLCLVMIIIASSLISYYAHPHFINDSIRRYKEYVFKKITQKNISAFSKENSSVYISALTNDTAPISTGLLENIFSFASSVLLFICALAMMAYYSPLLTITAILLALVPFAVSILFGNKAATAETRVSDENKEYVASIKDVLSGFSVVKSFKAEKEMYCIFSAQVKELASAQSKRDKIKIIISMLANISGLFTQFGVFLIAAYLSTKNIGITAGVVIMFVQMVNYIVSPISSIPMYYAQFKSSIELIRKCATVLEDNSIQESVPNGKKLEHGISIKDLSFSYGNEKQALSDINYSFELGKKYAIVGASGSGKSTLISMLMASHGDYKGSIAYDDCDMRNMNLEDLYEIQSLIQQNVFVFNSSILNNITMFKPFPEEDIERAVQLSGLTDLILEKGADYVCGENGSALSGGEKQRISIARALLKNSQVLLIDEATAALDAETAYQVTSSILGLDGVTAIEVTHALDAALLERYDGIIVMKNGTIIEEGKFDELIDRKGYFYSLFTVSQ